MTEGHGAQDVSQGIRIAVQQAVDILNQRGLQYEETMLEIAMKEPPRYEFMLPKSKHYRYYISQLFEKGPNRGAISRGKAGQLVVQGNIEELSVGAMCEIVKQETSQGKPSYQPYDAEPYLQQVDFDPTLPFLTSTKQLLITKINALTRDQNKERKELLKPVSSKPSANKLEEQRKEAGTNSDGSLGAWGGNKYEGLGIRDSFTAFRREKSQSYYSSMYDKSK